MFYNVVQLRTALVVIPDTDVRDLDGFMLNVERLLSSEFLALASPAEFRAGVLLWCRAWKQIPGGSLPNDERVLASFSGAGEDWPNVRDMALRGFVECSDGRLYHRVLCDDVKRAAQKKADFRARTAKASAARWAKPETNQQDEPDDNGVRNGDRNRSITTPQGQKQGQRQGQGQGQR